MGILLQSQVWDTIYNTFVNIFTKFMNNREKRVLFEAEKGFFAIFYCNFKANVIYLIY